MARAIITLPPAIRRGEVIDIRLLVQHAMETGYRTSSEGERLPRDLIRRVECHFEGMLVFAADLFPAIAANPYIAFPLRATASGTLVVRWTGDRGFAHSESARIEVT